MLGGWLKAEDGEIEESRVPHGPPAETGIIAQKHSRTTARHLLDGSAIPGTETNNSCPLDVLHGFFKTSLICIHRHPTKFGGISELFPFTRKIMHPFPSTTLKLPSYFILFPPGGDTHTAETIPGGPTCPGVGSGQLIGGHCHVAEVGSGKLP